MCKKIAKVRCKFKYLAISPERALISAITVANIDLCKLLNEKSVVTLS